MQCPKCDSPNVQRLEVIYESGTYDINTETVGMIGGGGFSGVAGSLLGGAVATSKTTGTQQSMLAQKVAPPPKKKLSGLLILVAIIGAIAYFIPTIIVLLIKKKNNMWNKTEWPALHKQWLQSWYCNKCGNIWTHKEIADSQLEKVDHTINR